MRGQLRALAESHGVRGAVRLCGRQSPEELQWFYGAADVFALATSHEGWANVFLEAMACGLPVVTTRVGGNAEVVAEPRAGHAGQLLGCAGVRATRSTSALSRHWDRERDRRVRALEHVGRPDRAAGREFRRSLQGTARGAAQVGPDREQGLSKRTA